MIAVNEGTPNEIRIVYDGDGNRVAKTVGGVKTKYLVDTNNLTGYAQVVEELTGISGQPAVVTRVYDYGLDLISQIQLIESAWTTSYYGYDGHGSVRFLTDASGAITDTYTYDAFGILISRTGTTPNNYLYCGEQFDSDLGFYFLRARYMNPSTGRFWSMDSFEGSSNDPCSLHKYLYASNNSTNMMDPSGMFTLCEAMIVLVVSMTVMSMACIAINSINSSRQDVYTVKDDAVILDDSIYWNTSDAIEAMDKARTFWLWQAGIIVETTGPRRVQVVLNNNPVRGIHTLSVDMLPEIVEQIKPKSNHLTIFADYTGMSTEGWSIPLPNPTYGTVYVSIISWENSWHPVGWVTTHEWGHSFGLGEYIEVMPNTMNSFVLALPFLNITQRNIARETVKTRYK